jgi:hypothetical protein
MYDDKNDRSDDYAPLGETARVDSKTKEYFERHLPREQMSFEDRVRSLDSMKRLSTDDAELLR